MAPRVSPPAARRRQPAGENASADGSRHADVKPVIDLENTYSQLATAWSQHELEARYRHAERHAEQPHEKTGGALSLVASAIPPAATMSVAIHVLHALPATAPDELTHQLLATASRNTASALRRCHRALHEDGAAHGYGTAEWLPVISDIADGIVESTRLNEEPPSVVAQAQQAIEWQCRAIVQLHDDSAEAASTLSEVLARLLVVSVFAERAQPLPDLG